MEEPGAKLLADRLGAVLPQLVQGTRQAERRMLKGDPVPSSEKLASLFEPHTQIIPRFKAGAAVESGRKVRLDEVEGGIISGFAVLEKSGGQDQPCLPRALAAHRRLFGRPPRLLAGDRGVSSAGNERLAKEADARHVALPHLGKPRRSGLRRRRVVGCGMAITPGRGSRVGSMR